MKNIYNKYVNEDIITPKIYVNFFIYTYSMVSIIERILQIIHYTNTSFINDKIKDFSLMMILIRPIVFIISFSIHISIIKDNLLSFSDRLINLLIFISSSEINFTIGVQYSLISKWKDGDIPIYTMRLLQIFQFLFTSLPSLIIVPIHSMALNFFSVIDTLSILFSSLSICFSLIYFIFSSIKYDVFNDVITNMFY